MTWFIKTKINLFENSNKFLLNANYIIFEGKTKVKDTIKRVITISNKERNLSSNFLFKIILMGFQKFI